MNKRHILSYLVLLLSIPFLLSAAAVAESGVSPAGIELILEEDLTDDEIDMITEGDDGEEIPFDDAELYFELNDTDGDLGIHGLIDGEPWKWIQIESPDGRRKMKVTVHNSLRRHGLTELFFESAEPYFDELPPEVFFQRFPEGVWEVEGRSVEGDELEGECFLSHVIPAGPDGIKANGMELPEDCDEDPIPVVVAPVTISWDPVTEHHEELGNEGDVVAVGYEVVVEIEELGAKITANLPADVTEYTLSEDFTSLGSEFKVEILVYADSGNRSATETCFEIEEK